MHLPLERFSLLLLLPVLSTCVVHAGAATEPTQVSAARRHEEHFSDEDPGDAPGSGTEDASPSWWKGEQATGDWGGTRPRLEEYGTTVELLYTGEVFSNLHGGLRTDDSTRYRGNVDLVLGLDTAGLGLWPGGTAVLYLQNGHGRGISERYVGDFQIVSNIDADDFTQLSEYWFGQLLFEDRLFLKLGKQDANVDFCVAESGADFLHSSFGLVPTVPMPTFPDPGLGVAAFFEPVGWLALGAGVYDGDANGGTSGFDTAFDGKGGAFSVFELAARTSVFAETWPSGTYKLAGWHHSDDVEEITAAPAPDTFSNNYGAYLAFDQTLFRESSTNGQGLGSFLQFGWAPENRNELTLYVGAGLVYTGALPSRDEDVVGIGVAYAEFSDRLEDTDGLTNETALEIFYLARLTPWLAVQPDLQLVFNPGGDGDDAVAAGLRFLLDL